MQIWKSPIQYNKSVHHKFLYLMEMLCKILHKSLEGSINATYNSTASPLVYNNLFKQDHTVTQQLHNFSFMP